MSGGGVDRAAVGDRGRRRVLRALALGLGCGLGFKAQPAWADLWGGDVAVLIGIAKQLWDMYLTAQRTLEQIDNQVAFARRMASSITDRATHLDSVPEVFGVLDDMDGSYTLLQRNVTALGTDTRGMRDRFDKLFPSGKAVRGAKPGDYDSMYGGWQEEIRLAAGHATETQASALDARKRTEAAKKVLASRGDENMQGQLDRIVQMLGLMQGTLEGMSQQLATADRVTTTMAAASANEKIGEREIARQARVKQPKTMAIHVPSKLP